MRIISETVVHLRRPDKPEFGTSCSATFYEGSGNVPQMLRNLKERLDDGFVIDSVEVVQDAVPGDTLDIYLSRRRIRRDNRHRETGNG